MIARIFVYAGLACLALALLLCAGAALGWCPLP